MKTYIYSILFIVLTLFIGSCSSEKKAKQAETEIAVIEDLINKNFYNLAKIKIDSFHVNYRMMVDKRKIVAALEDTITLRESYRNIQYCDTVLPKLTHQLDSMMKNFRLEKDARFQETGDYVHKIHVTEQNVNRNYLKVKIDENGELKLFSYVTGIKISHNRLKVSAGEFFTQTDTLDSKNFSEHNFNDGNAYNELVIFGGESVENIVKFIFENQGSIIKVTLIGKKEFSYVLSTQDIKAISDSYHFWIVKKDIVKLEKQLKNSNFKIDRIKIINKNKQKI